MSQSGKSAKPLAIDRILQSQGFGTRRECRALVRSGQVQISGAVVKDPDQPWLVEGLAFRVRQTDWQYRERVCLMMHKPPGYECSSAASHHASVFELLPTALVVRGVQCVGRLDQDTTGLLLLTDDGKLLHRLTSPRHHVPKVYEVSTADPVDETTGKQLLAGVQLHDEPAPVAALAVELLDSTSLRMTIAQGRYHQIKRMIGATGNRVTALKRVRIGQLALPANLAAGEWRYLDHAGLELVSHT